MGGNGASSKKSGGGGGSAPRTEREQRIDAYNNRLVQKTINSSDMRRNGYTEVSSDSYAGGEKDFMNAVNRTPGYRAEPVRGQDSIRVSRIGASTRSAQLASDYLRRQRAAQNARSARAARRGR